MIIMQLSLVRSAAVRRKQYVINGNMETFFFSFPSPSPILSPLPPLFLNETFKKFKQTGNIEH